MKNHLLKKLTLPCVVILLILSMILSGCAGRATITAEDFKEACEAAGYTVDDVTSSFDSAYVSKVLIGGGDTYAVGYYTFVSAADAKSNYAQFLGDARTGVTSASEEKFVDSSEYNRYYTSTQYGTILLYRNGTTMFYLSGAETDVLNGIIETLGA